VVFPEGNKADWEELADDLKAGLTPHFVSTYDEVRTATSLLAETLSKWQDYTPSWLVVCTCRSLNLPWTILGWRATHLSHHLPLAAPGTREAATLNEVPARKNAIHLG
jgi:uroporphyrinogen-III synthase